MHNSLYVRQDCKFVKHFFALLLLLCLQYAAVPNVSLLFDFYIFKTTMLDYVVYLHQIMK